VGNGNRRSDPAAARGWALALTSVASLMVALDALVVTTALSTIRVHLHASIESLEWTVNAYNLSFAVLLMTAAVLGDRWGRRRLFVGGISLFTAASAACALAPGIGWLIAARTVQGVGAALVMPLAMVLLSAAFPPERRAWAFGIFSGITGIAVLGGPLIGGAVTQGLAWEWIFWLNLPIGVALVPLVLRRIPASPGLGGTLDPVGLALSTGGAFGLVWALVRGNGAGWGSAQVLGSLVGGLVLGAGFVAWEARVRHPLLPLRLFRSRAFSAGNAAAFLMYAALFGTVFFMAQYLQTGLGYGPLGAGLRLAPWTATLFLIAPASGALVQRFGVRSLVVVGLAGQAAGMAWLALLVRPGLAYPELIAPMMLAGVGISVAMPATQTGVMGAAPPEAVGQASGTFNTLRQLGGVFGLAVLVAVFAARGGYATAQAFGDGFSPALGAAAGLSFAGALAGLALPSRPTRTVPVEPVATPVPAGSAVTGGR
jgi:EmrB/QacA subfamily drug resistance transporter